MSIFSDKVKRVSIVRITRKFWDNEKQLTVTRDMYITSTERKPEHYLIDFKKALKEDPASISSKVIGLTINLSELSVGQVGTAIKGEEAASVKRYIDKYNTATAGWND